MLAWRTDTEGAHLAAPEIKRKELHQKLHVRYSIGTLMARSRGVMGFYLCLKRITVRFSERMHDVKAVNWLRDGDELGRLVDKER